jgi:hypothetical protein
VVRTEWYARQVDQPLYGHCLVWVLSTAIERPFSGRGRSAVWTRKGRPPGANAFSSPDAGNSVAQFLVVLGNIAQEQEPSASARRHHASEPWSLRHRRAVRDAGTTVCFPYKENEQYIAAMEVGL